MRNKKLEDKLKKKEASKWIKIIEMCESDEAIKEIHIKKGDMTASAVLNSMIETYLKDIGVKVFLEKKTIPKELCKSKVHKLFKLKLTLSKKIKKCEENGYSLFKVEKKTYVVCPNCYDFEEL